MKFSKILTSLTLAMIIILLPLKSEAVVFEEASIRLICALASMSAYNNDSSLSFREMLEARGWNIEPIYAETSKANAKAIFVTQTSASDKKIKILAVTGTEEKKDAEVDFRFGQVPIDLGGGNKDYDENYNNSDPDKVLVHRGFRDYTDVILENNLGENLVKELTENPDETLYITGHSLGGAVAILTAAKLSDLGAATDRIRVITFGAPAVGNRAFVNNYSDKINLTRITVTGDPIKKSLKVLGYVHFGDPVKYKPAKSSDHFPHKMALYLDCAIRDFYDAEDFKSVSVTNNNGVVDTKIYIAPIRIIKGSFSKLDLNYVKKAMKDSLITRLPNAVFDSKDSQNVIDDDDFIEFDDTIDELIKSAKAANCSYVLIQNLQAKKIRDDVNSDYRVTVEEIIYDLNGMPISMQTASATTKDLTMIEAAIFSNETLRPVREEIFAKEN